MMALLKSTKRFITLLLFFTTTCAELLLFKLKVLPSADEQYTCFRIVYEVKVLKLPKGTFKNTESFPSRIFSMKTMVTCKAAVMGQSNSHYCKQNENGMLIKQYLDYRGEKPG